MLVCIGLAGCCVSGCLLEFCLLLVNAWVDCDGLVFVLVN